MEEAQPTMLPQEEAARSDSAPYQSTMHSVSVNRACAEPGPSANAVRIICAVSSRELDSGSNDAFEQLRNELQRRASARRAVFVRPC